MKFKGKVIDRTPVETVGQKLHPKFTFVVEETEGEYPQKAQFEAFGDSKVDKLDPVIAKDSIVEVDFDLDARQSDDGRWWTSLKAWKATVIKNNTGSEGAF